MEIVVKSRHIDVSDRFRQHVEEKLSRLEKHDHRLIRVEVEVARERNPRQQDRAVRVELTAFSKGPVIRAEAAAEDKMTALDMALDRMTGQMRRASDRRRVHRGRHAPESLRDGSVRVGAVIEVEETVDDVRQVGPVSVVGEGPLVVREKIHSTSPMTLDQALYEMELVGHDFFLFVDKESDRPSVVYRRRGYDYGVIALDLS
jgi:ribosomal subunit interface protein